MHEADEMRHETPRRERRARPLDAVRLDELALVYVARFATSTGRLGAYLARKVKERGWEGDSPADIDAIVARMVERGYVDDAGYAQARGQGLLRRGYGARRVAESLSRDGIARPLVEEASGSERERRLAALAFARRRRMGPFARPGTFGAGSAGDDEEEAGLDPAMRARQVAAFLRAGHSLGAARALIEAADVASAEEWVDEADDS